MRSQALEESLDLWSVFFSSRCPPLMRKEELRAPVGDPHPPASIDIAKRQTTSATSQVTFYWFAVCPGSLRALTSMTSFMFCLRCDCVRSAATSAVQILHVAAAAGGRPNRCASTHVQWPRARRPLWRDDGADKTPPHTVHCRGPQPEPKKQREIVKSCPSGALCSFLPSEESSSCVPEVFSRLFSCRYASLLTNRFYHTSRPLLPARLQWRCLAGDFFCNFRQRRFFLLNHARNRWRGPRARRSTFCHWPNGRDQSLSQILFCYRVLCVLCAFRKSLTNQAWLWLADCRSPDHVASRLWLVDSAPTKHLHAWRSILNVSIGSLLYAVPAFSWVHAFFVR